MANDAITVAAQNIAVAINSLNTATQALNATLKSVLPAVQSTSTSATAGTAGPLPAEPAGYLNITLPDGKAARVPYYNP